MRGEVNRASGNPCCICVRRGASSFRARNVLALQLVADSPNQIDSVRGVRHLRQNPHLGFVQRSCLPMRVGTATKPQRQMQPPARMDVPKCCRCAPPRRVRAVSEFGTWPRMIHASWLLQCLISWSKRPTSVRVRALLCSLAHVASSYRPA